MTHIFDIKGTAAFIRRNPKGEGGPTELCAHEPISPPAAGSKTKVQNQKSKVNLKLKCQARIWILGFRF